MILHKPSKLSTKIQRSKPHAFHNLMPPYSMSCWPSLLLPKEAAPSIKQTSFTSQNIMHDFVSVHAFNNYSTLIVKYGCQF